MTIRFVGPRRAPEQPVLSASQLAAVLSALCHGVAQAARRHRTPPPTIQSWIELQRRRLPDRKWHWKTEKVAEWVLSQREQQLSVSEDELLQTARKALGRDGEPSERYSWAADFLLRHELGLQPAAGQQGRLPCTVRENSLAFISALSTQIHGQRVPPHCVASMDEFSIFTDLDWISDQDRSALRFFGSSGDRPSLDVVLSACSDGTLLPPLLFFGGPASPLPDGFPDNVLLEARQEGFSDQDRLHMWINKVWRPREASRCDGQRVLMVDVHRGHLSSEFRSRLTAEATDVVFIPSGCSSRLQPLDVCVTPVLRDFLQVRWTQLLSQGGLDGLGLDQLALTLACWFSEVSSTLNSEADVLRRSFALACDPKSLEGRGEAAKMIQALRETLVQSLDSPEAPRPDPDLGPGPDLELLLVMEEEQVQQEVKKEESKSPSAVYDADSNKDPLP